MKAPRKNIERMEEYVEGGDYECTRHFVSESPRSHLAVLDHVARDVGDAIGGEESDLLPDESGFTKKGTRSVGVARQYNGRLGKVDTCQVGVFGALSDGSRVSLFNKRHYFPREWTSSPERCEAADIPEPERGFKTEPQLALEIVDNARSNGVAFGCVSFDGFYGAVPDFIAGLVERDRYFVGAVHRDQLVHEDDPRADTTEETIFKQLEKRRKKRKNAMETAYQTQRERYPKLKFNLTK